MLFKEMQMYQHVESGAHETKIFGVLSGLSIFSSTMIPGIYSATVPDTDVNTGPRYDYMLVNVEGAQIGSGPWEAKINTLFSDDSWKRIFAADANTLIIDPHCSLHSTLFVGCWWRLLAEVCRLDPIMTQTIMHVITPVACSFLNIAKLVPGESHYANLMQSYKVWAWLFNDTCSQ